MAGQEAAIGALGAVVLFGVLGRVFLKKTGFSDVFLLILIGAAAGAFLPTETVSTLGSFLLPVGVLALLMILLDEGLHLSLDSLKRQFHKVLLFWLLSFTFAFAVSFSLTYLFFGGDLFLSLLVGVIFSSVAPEILSGFLTALRSPESVKTIGELEATISDALSVMLALLLVGSVHGGGFLRASALTDELPVRVIIIALSSIAIGAVFAAFWRAALVRVAEEHEHLLAIALAALLYALSGIIGANGVIAVFTFGFFLGNTAHKAVEEVKRFQYEISFFLRTFFLIYLGALLFHTPKPLEIALFALCLSILLALVRMLSGRVVGVLESSTRRERLLEQISSRGLTAAVLSVVVYQELSAASAAPAIDLPLLALFVIFFTNAISAWLVLKRFGKRKEEERQFGAPSSGI